MSLIETQTPQKPKIRYEGSRQDHGDAAAERELRHRRDDRADPYDLRGFKKEVNEHLQEGLANEGGVSDDLFNISAFDMNPDQLEAAADAILGEVKVEVPDILKASKDILERMTNDEDEATVTDLLDEYQSIYLERIDLLDERDIADDETAAELWKKAEAIAERCEEIEDEIMETLTYQDGCATEAELGLDSKHDIRKKMARRVTLDVAYEEDDSGDGDYHIPVHITTRP